MSPFAVGLECEMHAAAADILRRRRRLGIGFEQRVRLGFGRHVEFVAQTLRQRLELALGCGPIAAQHQVANEVACIDFAERIERHQAAGMRGGGCVVARRMLLLHHPLERLDRAAAQGLPAEERPLVELRTVAGREAVEKVGLIESAGALERAAVASLFKQA